MTAFVGHSAATALVQTPYEIGYDGAFEHPGPIRVVRNVEYVVFDVLYGHTIPGQQVFPRAVVEMIGMVGRYAEDFPPQFFASKKASNPIPVHVKNDSDLTCLTLQLVVRFV